MAAIHVAEGDRVAPGDPIAGVDTTLNEAQLNQAQTAVAQAQAQVALLKAGAPPADIDVARAMVGQARAAAAAARTAWDDAQALVHAPGDLDVRIAQTEAAVQIAETQLNASQAGATSADLQNGLWERTVQSLEQGVHVDKTFQVPNVPGKEVHISGHYDAPAYVLNPARYQWNLSSQQTWQAYAQVGISDASLAAVRQTLADLHDQKDQPTGPPGAGHRGRGGLPAGGDGRGHRPGQPRRGVGGRPARADRGRRSAGGPGAERREPLAGQA